MYSRLYILKYIFWILYSLKYNFKNVKIIFRLYRGGVKFYGVQNAKGLFYVHYNGLK